MNIAIIGSGVSGLAAAWLLSSKHTVTLYEKDDRLGGHANTQVVSVNDDIVPVDTGFIVYNERTYPNLTAMFDALGVATDASDMSFAVSADDGGFEYAGTDLKGLFAQKRNLVNPTFWKMVLEIKRFYDQARAFAKTEDAQNMTLGSYLDRNGYSRVFCEKHLLPMGAAIWSMPAEKMLEFPFCSFVQFCDNHGLLQMNDRPQWRTVREGSISYVNRLAAGISGPIYLNRAVQCVNRPAGFVEVVDRSGEVKRYDNVVFACHSDQAHKILKNSETGLLPEEDNILGALKYQKNVALLHTDKSLMPKRISAWSSWNYMMPGQPQADSCVSVTYWMNRLQKLSTDQDLFISLNPLQQPRSGTILRTFAYDHPVMDLQALEAQKALWSLQGQRRTWFCGAYFGHGFHEDGLQSGLAIAEQLGNVRRPWNVEQESGRINIGSRTQSPISEAAE